MPETIENKVQCPKCGYSFPITDAVLGPLRSQITTELEKGFQIRIDKGREEIEKAAQQKAENNTAKITSELGEQIEESKKEMGRRKGAV